MGWQGEVFRKWYVLHPIFMIWLALFTCHMMPCQLILLMKADLHPNCAAPSAKRLTALNILMVAKDPFMQWWGSVHL